MTETLLVLSFLAAPERLVPEREVRELVAVARAAEERHHLPLGLLLAVVLAESGGRRNLVVRWTGKNRLGCDTGAGQVHVPMCEQERVRRLLLLSVNLDRSASLLARSERRCLSDKRPHLRACRRSPWALYNAGSTRWWPRVARIWRRLLGRGEA